MRTVRAIAIVALCAACTSGAEQRSEPQFGTWRQVAFWPGRGNAQLETFAIGTGRLRVAWEARNESSPGAGRLKVRLHSADSGRVLADLVDRQGVGGDTIDITDDHQRFYISVESSAVDWTVRVDELTRR